ncbi:MAG TPA: Mur ligase family protein, partial [Nitrospirota bacterium]
ADESDGSFLVLSPTIAVVTNIDEEHLDHYTGGLPQIKEAFLTFINKIPFYGLAVLCLDERNLQELIPQVKKRFTTFGLSTQADLYARDINYSGMGSSFEVYRKGESLGRFSLEIPGQHNIYNALAAIAVGLELDVPVETIHEALAGFGGLHRRFYVKGEAKGIMVVDDYGHHPTEIKATLAGAKNGWGRRTVIVFQPHRYTRTRDLQKEFYSAFNQADRLLVLDIYAAGEKPIEGVSAQSLCDGIKSLGHKEAYYVKDAAGAVEWLDKNLAEGDILITLGAGDVWKIGETVLEKLKS